MHQNTSLPPSPTQQTPQAEPPPSQLDIIRQRLRRFAHRFRPVVPVLAGMLLALLGFIWYDASKPPPQHLTQRDINAAVVRAMASATPAPSLASRVFEIIQPSLVRIEARTVKLGSKPEAAVGTGVVFDDNGTVLSSLHIVRDATAIRLFFADGSDTEAAIVAKIPESDLVVLRPQVIPDDLIPATLTADESLQVGDEVFAAGNPFGIHNALSAGVVSRLGWNYKSLKSGITLSNLIMFDAAVNPGNSGGPLLNRDGEVVGIVTGLLNPTEQEVFIGIGFAVPIGAAAAAMGEPPY